MRGIVLNVFQTWFTVSYILCIISISVISFFVLRDYIKMNPILYFALFSLPVIYVLFKFIPPAMSLVITMIMKDPIFYGTLYTLFFSGTGPLTGFLFFLPMWFFAASLGIPKLRGLFGLLHLECYYFLQQINSLHYKINCFLHLDSYLLQLRGCQFI